MFHIKDNVFFGRLENGDVRVLAFSSPPESFPIADGIYDPTDKRYPITFDFTINADAWASVVASVSAGGEINGRFYVAQAFHHSIEL